MFNFFKYDYSISSDEELMLFIANGKERAFNELYKRYSKKILYFFYTKLNNDNEKANDFLQDLFLKIIEQPHLFDHNKKFSTWMYTIAYNMCKNEYKKNKIRGTKIVDFDFNKLIDGAANSVMLDKNDQEFFNDQLNIVLNKLEDIQSTTFILRGRFKYQMQLFGL